MCLDNNKRVQEAGCSAFAVLEEEACDELIPYLDHILQTLLTGFNKYQERNLNLLYDALGTLADSVSSALNQKKYIDAIMPALINKWQQYTDDDENIFGLFECLTPVAVALGPGFQPYAAPIWERCVRIIQSVYHAEQIYLQNPSEAEFPNKDFATVSLDLLAGIIQALGPQAEPLLASTQPAFIDLLLACMKDNTPEVRQSAFASIGDICSSCFTYLKPHLSQILPLMINEITLEVEFGRASAMNNSIWASGEITVKFGAEIQPFVNALLERLIPLLQSAHTSNSIRENSAVTIGRLGFACPQLVSPHLESFIVPWCNSLRYVRDTFEKESAFMGLCRMVETNPHGVTSHFQEFVLAISSWYRPNPELGNYFRKLLLGYKQAMGPNWDNFLATLPVDIRKSVVERYGL